MTAFAKREWLLRILKRKEKSSKKSTLELHRLNTTHMRINAMKSSDVDADADHCLFYGVNFGSRGRVRKF